MDAPDDVKECMRFLTLRKFLENRLHSHLSSSTWYERRVGRDGTVACMSFLRRSLAVAVSLLYLANPEWPVLKKFIRHSTRSIVMKWFGLGPTIADWVQIHRIDSLDASCELAYGISLCASHELPHGASADAFAFHVKVGESG